MPLVIFRRRANKKKPPNRGLFFYLISCSVFRAVCSSWICCSYSIVNFGFFVVFLPRFALSRLLVSASVTASL